jgi:hypothetical protein
MLALAVAGLAGAAEAGSIKGTVRDQAKAPPANGLSGAKVWLRLPNDSLRGPVLTDTVGEYRIHDVSNGMYRLVVRMTGYIPNPHDQTTIMVRGDATASDVGLVRAWGSNAYYSDLAGVIVEKAAAAPQHAREKELTREWNNLRTINLPPSSKVIVAVKLHEQDASAKELIPDLKAYVAAKPEAVMKAQTLFSQALAGKGSLPGKGSLDHLKLDDEIIADVVLFQVKDTSVPEAKRKAFVNEFLLKWDNTTASARFLAIQ